MGHDAWEGLNSFERQILDSAYHGELLIEFRNGNSELPDVPIDVYRQRMADALLAMVDRGLAMVEGTRWRDDYDARWPLAREQLRERLENGTAWDPDSEPLIGLDITREGRSVLGLGAQ
jgi:hypothetical protein